MDGSEAWIKLVRYIGHGRPTRLENISRGMQIAHQRLIDGLTNVAKA